jgi:oligoendopeptidase F
MSLLPFGKLAPHRPRTFVPPDINLGDWPQVAPLFDRLEARAAQAKSVAQLERWLIDWSELNAALDEEASRRYIAMTCHYAVFDRDVKNHVELFRPENVALETEEAKLSQQYQKLIGAQTVTFRGEEKTLVQMGRYLEGSRVAAGGLGTRR